MHLKFGFFRTFKLKFSLLNSILKQLHGVSLKVEGFGKPFANVPPQILKSGNNWETHYAILKHSLLIFPIYHTLIPISFHF